MALEFEDHPFWDFSLKVYGTEGVPAACLVLQERHQIDVNVMLFCGWVGQSGRGTMGEADLRAALDAVSAWHQGVVRALRAVRTRLKGGLPPAPGEQCKALRRRILKIEVDSEHLEQLMLAHAVDLPADDGLPADRRIADALANVMAYFGAHGARPDADDAAQLAVVLRPAFPDIDGEIVGGLCRAAVA